MRRVWYSLCVLLRCVCCLLVLLQYAHCLLVLLQGVW